MTIYDLEAACLVLSIGMGVMSFVAILDRYAPKGAKLFFCLSFISSLSLLLFAQKITFVESIEEKEELNIQISQEEIPFFVEEDKIKVADFTNKNLKAGDIVIKTTKTDKYKIFKNFDTVKYEIK